MLIALQYSSFFPAQHRLTRSSIDKDNFSKLKAAYDACMDEEAVQQKGIEPLQKLLHQVADMFPVKESAFQERTALVPKDEEDLADTMLFLANIGVPSLVACGAGADDKDPDVVVVQCSPPYRVGLPAKDYYSDDDVVQKYQKTLAQVLENLFPDYGDENVTLFNRWTQFGGHSRVAARGKGEDFARDVIALEKGLAAASPDAEDRGDVTVSL
jgi:endothelin-converting enzyme